MRAVFPSLGQKRAGEMTRVDDRGRTALKTNKIAISILLISAAFANPASANYFANPALNMRFNIGSSPTPTVWDIRHNYMPQMTRNNHPKFDVAKSLTPGKSAASDQSDASKVSATETVPARISLR
jgi:hypothetical protein